MNVTAAAWTYSTNQRADIPARLTPLAERPRWNKRPRSIVTDAPRPGEEVEGATGTFTVEGDGEWSITFKVEFVDGQPIPSEVTIRPLHRREAIGARSWKQFRLGELEKLVQFDVAMIMGMLPREVIPKGYKRPMPGRRGESDLEYARRAERYVTAVREHPKSPVAWLAEHDLGENSHANRQAIRRWRMTAEKRGLITPVEGAGRAGGELTDKARALLDGGR
jgi:hypothetical protein